MSQLANRVNPGLIALAAASFAATVVAEPRPSRPPAPTETVVRGRTFAEAHCASCHAVAPNGTSPNPESPPFDDIANRDGVTTDTLAAFLTDAHNYPDAMDFAVPADTTGDLAAYILAMRRQGYAPSR